MKSITLTTDAMGRSILICGDQQLTLTRSELLDLDAHVKSTGKSLQENLNRQVELIYRKYFRARRDDRTLVQHQQVVPKFDAEVAEARAKEISSSVENGR